MANRSPVFLVIGAAVVAAVVDLAVVGVFHFVSLWLERGRKALPLLVQAGFKRLQGANSCKIPRFLFRRPQVSSRSSRYLD
jgi:hypothetical protein